MREIKIPGMGSVMHPGTEEEADEHEKLLKARAAFVAKYCKEKGWPLPDEPGFEQLSWDNIMEVRAQEGWKNPFGQEDPQETAIILGKEQSVIVPKDRK